jgi:hypothetical protein
MRSAHEIASRLRQELVNLKLFAIPPTWNGRAQGVLPGLLPDPRRIALRLSSTAFAADLEQLAPEIMSHRFPLLGTSVDTGPAIQWRRDYVNEKETGLSYFRRILYLDFERAGDHKWIWELNRHQHLVALAQAYLFSPRDEYLAEISDQIESWQQQNPFQCGINWASALEVGFRAVSWIWILHLTGPALPESTRQRLEEGLHLHGCYLENNLSFYFSPNTHLLGEVVALHAIGRCLPHLPRSERWMNLARPVVEDQMERQIRDDGSHFEQSTYYHVYALDMFLLHAVLSSPPQSYLTKLRQMADYLDAVMGVDRRLPFFGDDDGGRWFHPYGTRDTFGRATLATCCALLKREDWSATELDYHPQANWWLECEPRQSFPRSSGSILFRDSGLAVLCSQSSKIVVDCGPFGPSSASHSHADTLSFTVSAEGEEILFDSGTFTYVGNGALRDEFRGTAAHNTVRIDGANQADAVSPFRWANPPAMRVLSWLSRPDGDILEAECRYRGFIHKRYFHLLKPSALLIVDEVSGATGEHHVEQFWHLASESAASRLILSGPTELLQGWRSRCFSQREPIPVRCVRTCGALPIRLAAAVCLDTNAHVAIALGERNTVFTVTSPNGTKTAEFNAFSN